MKKIFLFLLFAAWMVSCQDEPKYDLVIANVNLFDGHNDLGTVNIAINEDTIAKIAAEPMVGDSTVDATGKYIIPGLVNAHVHASSVEHLKQGFDLGIMYLLNMHTGLEERERTWKQWSKDSTGYSVLYGSGHAATVPGGHPNQFSPEMETINDSVSVEQWVDNRLAQEVDYIKIVRDNHEWMGYPALPTLSYEQIGEIITYAKSKGHRSVVHANTSEEMTRIAAYGPSGFVHMLDYSEDYPVAEEYFEVLAENNVFVIPTSGISLKPMDGAPPFMVEWVSDNLLNAEQRAEVIKKYKEYGILLVAGTDAQEGQMDFGADYFLELKLYQMAGLSNLEILRTATGNAAQAFGLPIGEVSPGGAANFVLLSANPLENMENLRMVEQVWKNGKPN